MLHSIPIMIALIIVAAVLMVASLGKLAGIVDSAVSVDLLCQLLTAVRVSLSLGQDAKRRI